jgi:hypothetical protein
LRNAITKQKAAANFANAHESKLKVIRVLHMIRGFAAIFLSNLSLSVKIANLQKAAGLFLIADG